jgi:hypothetical protein
MEDRSSRRVRIPVTLTARRGLSANEIACALISMMARSTCSNRRPNTLTQDRISQRRLKPLTPRGRTIHRGQSLHFDGRPATSDFTSTSDLLLHRANRRGVPEAGIGVTVAVGTRVSSRAHQVAGGSSPPPVG